MASSEKDIVDGMRDLALSVSPKGVSDGKKVSPIHWPVILRISLLMQTSLIGDDHPSFTAERALGHNRRKPESLRQSPLPCKSRHVLEKASWCYRAPRLERSGVDEGDMDTDIQSERAPSPRWMEVYGVSWKSHVISMLT